MDKKFYLAGAGLAALLLAAVTASGVFATKVPESEVHLGAVCFKNGQIELFLHNSSKYEIDLTTIDLTFHNKMFPGQTIANEGFQFSHLDSNSVLQDTTSSLMVHCINVTDIKIRSVQCVINDKFHDDCRKMLDSTTIELDGTVAN